MVIDSIAFHIAKSHFQVNIAFYITVVKSYFTVRPCLFQL